MVLGTLPPKVLVVDDVKINRLVLCRILDRLGFHAVECCTGAEALQAFNTHGSQIACILMDINMPEMDGLEATFLIRQEESRKLKTKETPGAGGQKSVCMSKHSNASVPIWAISACCDDEQWRSPVLAYLADDRQKGPLWKRAGIDAFLPKPVNASELREKLQLLNFGRLETRRQGLMSHRLESWEDKGLKRRCSFEGSAPQFAKRGLNSSMQQGS